MVKLHKNRKEIPREIPKRNANFQITLDTIIGVECRNKHIIEINM